MRLLLVLIPLALLLACEGTRSVGTCYCDCPPPEVNEYTPAEGGHVEMCQELAFPTSPPHSGYHYGFQARFKTYQDSIPYGYLVHSMEHGGVIIGYNCPGGCPEEVALVQAWIDNHPVDPPHPDCARITCLVEPQKRFILAPDPRLEVRWAASAWGSTWTSHCPVDTASLGAYARSHYRQGPEDLMLEYGEDYSAWGWCPWPPPDTASP